MPSTPPTFDDLVTRIELAWEALCFDEQDTELRARHDEPHKSLWPKFEAFDALVASLEDAPNVRSENFYRLGEVSTLDFPCPFVIEACLTPKVTVARKDVGLKQVSSRGEVLFLEVLLCSFTQVAEARWYLLRSRGKQVQTFWYPALDRHWVLARSQLSHWIRRLYRAAQDQGIAMLDPALTGRGTTLSPPNGPPPGKRPSTLRGWLFAGAEEADGLTQRGPDDVPPEPRVPLSRFPRVTARAERVGDPSQWVEVTLSLVEGNVDAELQGDYFAPAPGYAPTVVPRQEGVDRERLVRGWESGVATGSQFVLRSVDAHGKRVVLWALSGCLDEGGDGVSCASVAATAEALGEGPESASSEWRVTAVSSA